MSRVMLINGQHAEEIRVAIVDNGRLEVFQVDVAEEGLERGNIYLGLVSNVERSLNAAFVDYGNVKHGFLASQDIVPQACHHRQPPTPSNRPPIDELVEKGRPILVQVTRDASGTKGAVLTTNISFAGRYLVITPYDASSGLSRKIEDPALRDELRSKLESIPRPEGLGYIIRTSAVDQTKVALKRDLSALRRLWQRVLTESKKKKRAKNSYLLYDDQDLVIQALRDYLDPAVEEVYIDNKDLHQRAEAYVRATMPRSQAKLVPYSGRVPLFSKFNLEPQIDSIFKRNVALPTGGSIVIDRTEALTAIDVNSGRNRRATNQEDTAYTTNVEAAHEVCRQLRLRDIGGLVVVDFIDMRSAAHRAKIERAVRDALKQDKARASTTRISTNGLMEINRQRIKQAVGQRSHRVCPTCEGVGLLATPDLLGLRLIRRIEARAATGRAQSVSVGLHPELADAIQNRRRAQLAALEREFDIEVEIIAATHLHRSQEEIKWTARSPDDARMHPSLQEISTAEQVPAHAPVTASSATTLAQPESDGSDSEIDSAGHPDAPKRRRRPRRRRRRSEGPTTPSEVLETTGSGPSTALSRVPTVVGPPPPSDIKPSPPPTTTGDAAPDKKDDLRDTVPRSRRRRRSRRTRRVHDDTVREKNGPPGTNATDPSSSGPDEPKATDKRKSDRPSDHDVKRSADGPKHTDNAASGE